MVWGRPSSSSLKSSLPRFVTIAPFLSRTVASTFTTLTSTEMPGLSGVYCAGFSCAASGAFIVTDDRKSARQSSAPNFAQLAAPHDAANAVVQHLRRMHSQEWLCHRDGAATDKETSDTGAKHCR